MRKVSELINNAQTKRAVVRRDIVNDEYVVSFYDACRVNSGVWIKQSDADYHTDDKGDAISTAHYMVEKE